MKYLSRTPNKLPSGYKHGLTSMPKDPRILNLTRGFRLKPAQAYRAIENCSCEWVEVGVSVRDLTLAESIQARNSQAKEREPLAYAEIPGMTFDGKRYPELVKAAHEFHSLSVA